MISRLQKRYAVLTGLTLLLTGSVVLGQANPPGPPAPPAATPSAPDVSVTGKKRANISSDDMQEQAASLRKEMGAALTSLVTLQESVKKQKDIIKLTCVNDKLVLVKQLLNIADTAQTNLSEAIARGDEEGRYHEFARVTVAQQEVAGLQAEAKDCAGEADVSFLGPTDVEVEGPDTFIDFEEQPDFDVVEPLPVASPQGGN
jgi:hypothetical protein